MAATRSDTHFFHVEFPSTRILVREWSPEGPEQGEVLLLHGLGDHSGRHEWAASVLLGAGFRVVGFDWPGNGESDGIRGDMPTVNESCDLLDEVVGRLGLSPNGVFAHSTGAFLAIPWLASRGRDLPGLRWVWFSSPLLFPSHGQPRLKVAAAKILSRRFPRMTLSNGVRVRDCYHTGFDPAAESALTRAGGHHRVSLRFAMSLLEEEKRVLDSAGDLREDLDYLLTQGVEDRICPPGFAGSLFATLPPPRRTCLLAAGSRHEPFREPEAESFNNAVRAWLGRRTGR